MLLVAVALVGAACSNKDDNDKKSSKTPGDNQQVIRAPLTGREDPSGDSLKRSALTIKIANTPDARPQTGMELADVVYEEVVEGNITRFLTVFNSQIPEAAGPIRSVRGMDPSLLTPIGGIFAYSGGAAANVQKIQRAPVLSLDETRSGDAMYRERSRRAPQNLYGYPGKMYEKNGNPGPVPPRPLFKFLNEKGDFAGEAVTSFTPNFSSGYAPTYTWDENSGTWLRAIGSNPFTMASGKQIAPENVIVQFISYPSVSEGISTGEGEAWVFSDGEVLKGRWKRTSDQDVTEFRTADGKEIKLTPGSTWVELLPNSSTVDVVSPPPTTSAPSTTKK